VEDEKTLKEFEAKNSLKKLFDEKYRPAIENLQKRFKECADKEAAIAVREADMIAQSAAADSELREKRRDAQADIARYAQSEKQKIDAEMENWRAKETARIEHSIAQMTENRHRQLDAEIEAERTERRAAIASERKQLENERGLFTREKEKFEADKSSLIAQKQELEFEKQEYAALKERCDERLEELENRADEIVNDKIRDLEGKLSQKDEALDRLLSERGDLLSQLKNYEDLKRQLDGKTVRQAYDEITQTRAKNEAALKASYEKQQAELQNRFKELSAAYSKLEQDRERDKARLEEAEKLDALKTENEDLRQKAERLEQKLNTAIADFNDVSEKYQQKLKFSGPQQDKESRLSAIQTPHFMREKLYYPPQNYSIEEKDFLANIEKGCKAYGFTFERRILYAFHTALKTFEWNPLTILAGVSGTGKSELPKLYAHFGGINFLSKPVSASWDSHESLIGYYNSIDGRFEAEDVVRLLYQTQQPASESYPGLKDYITLILLDEMNLAHPELYFSEFLSRLEERRSKGEPNLEINLGSGMKEPLPLGRNVLWAGTMNQDETTKSLSDKVLDRGIVINFPQPSSFERRETLKWLPLYSEMNDPRRKERFSDATLYPAPLLPRTVWQKWWTQKSALKPDEIKEYQTRVERISRYLGNANRALGHRVWQSIEYYMSNYPGVDILRNDSSPAGSQERKDIFEKTKPALDKAFEDQLVQKVMPKLRGIETSGVQKTDCLDKIQAEMPDSLKEDFKHAVDFGSGQFIWSSAMYLEKEREQAQDEGGDDAR
jgi:hypothetical protein